MHIKLINYFKFIFFSTFLTLFISVFAHSALDISIAPLRGGTTLQFSRNDVLSQTGCEVRLRLTSTDNRQYEVFQRWIQPLTSSTGGLPQRDALRFYAVSGSNSSGTLYANVPEDIRMSDHLLYTSSPSGASDNLILVYQVDPDKMRVGGQLMGRLVFTVRPIGGGAAQDVFLDVFIDANLGFDISIRGEKNSQAIHLSTHYVDAASDKIEFSFKSNIGPVRIYQELLTPLVSTADQSELPRGAVQYTGVGHSSGLKFSGAHELDFNRVLIYESTLMEDQWALMYELVTNRFSVLKAGTYKGRVRYSIESSNARNDLDFDIEVDIAPIFEISFELPDGPIDFSKVLLATGPQERLVRVRVKTNLCKPYIVSQKVADHLRNQKGEVLNNDYFLVKTLGGAALTGEVKFPDFSPVKISSDQTLFVSDRQGSPTEFRVFYRLVPYDDMSPGNYRTEITYSLGQI